MSLHPHSNITLIATVFTSHTIRNSYQKLMMMLVFVVWFGMMLSATHFMAHAQDDIIEGSAFINDVVVERNNNSVQLVVYGELGDACTELGAISQTISNDIISVTIATTRPADLMCAAVIESFNTTITLDTTGAVAGVYTLDVNGYVTIINLTESDIEASSASIDTERPVCYQPTDSTETVIDYSTGVCFLAPAGVAFNTPYADSLVIRTNNDALQTQVAMLIRSVFALRNELSEIEQVQFDIYDDAEFRFERTTLGGYDTTYTDNLPNNERSRRGFMVTDERLFRITIIPFGIDDEIIRAQANDLWDLLATSIVVIGAGELEFHALDDVHAEFVLPDGWQIEASAGGYTVTDADGTAQAGFIQFDTQESVEATLANIADIYGIAVNGEVPIERVGKAVSAQLDAYRLDIEGTCKAYVSIQEDDAIALLIAPSACDATNTVINFGVEVLLDTLQFDN